MDDDRILATLYGLVSVSVYMLIDTTVKSGLDSSNVYKREVIRG